MIKKYFQKHFRFEEVFDAPPTAEDISFVAKRQRKRSFFIFLQFLKLLPIVCGLAFAISFFWDYGPDDSWMILGQDLKMEAFIRMVAVSGLIGFGTNWVAVKMLFKPVYRRPIWGQGLIPAHKERIVWNLAGGIHKHILNEELIRDRITKSGLTQKISHLLVTGVQNLLDDEEFSREVKLIAYSYLKERIALPETRERFTNIIDEKLDDNINKGLPGFVFKAYKALNRKEYEMLLNKILDRVPGIVVEVIEEVESETEAIGEAIRAREHEMEALLLRVVIDVLDRIDIRTLLSKQMAHFDEARLEQLIWSATNEQLLYIEYLGTLLGILGGLLIWQPVVVGIFFISLIAVLFLLDQVLFTLKKNNIGSRKA
jgi:uncharacterized membrane protein YheB (UPF0754 family)